MSFRHKFLSAIPVIVLATMLFGATTVVIWGANRSLGLTDEGVYLLAARYPAEVQQNVSAVYWYTGFLFRMAGYDVMIFRLFGVISILLSAFAFWLGFDKLVLSFFSRAKGIKHFRFYSLLFIEMGALLYYQWCFETPNYYTLTAVAVNVFAGSLMFGLALLESKEKNKKIIYLAFTITGLALGLALFVKFPTAIGLFLIYISIVAFWKSINSHEKLRGLIAVLAGLTIWILCNFTFVQTPNRIWEMFRTGWRLYQTFGTHAPQEKFFAYPKDVVVLIYSALHAFWPCYLIIISAFVYSAWRRHNFRSSDRILTHVTLIVVVMAALMSIKAGIFVDEPQRYVGVVNNLIRFYVAFYLAWIFLLLAVCFFHSKYYDTTPQSVAGTVDRNRKIIFGFLISLPIAGAVGTQNPLSNVVSFYAAPWFGAIFLLLTIIVFSYQNKSALLVFAVLFIGWFSASQIIQGSVFQPAQTTNLLGQTIPTNIGFPPCLIKLTPQKRELVQQISALARANGFQPGDDIIGISYIPGMVFALGGRSPGHPAFLIGNQHHLEYSKMALQFSDRKRLKKALVLLMNADSKSAGELLNSRGLDFPAKYKLIGQGPRFALYKPNE